MVVSSGLMGCDIHCYIEYRKPNQEDWSDFGGRINPGRNYWMFGFMAGVRSDFPHIDPRGFPEDAAYSAFNDNTIYISDTQTDNFRSEDGEYYYSKSHAADCVAKGYCYYITRNGHQRWVTNSDHHSHSWLDASEFELCIAGYLKESGFQINTPRLMGPEALNGGLSLSNDQSYALSCITEYWAILAALRCLEAQGNQVRLVFWFDN